MPWGEFASGRARALVATDVAARGIHVDQVGCVLHFDLPADDKTYLHRSGRTGRAGATGTVVSLVGGSDVKQARLLQRTLGLDVPVQAPPAAGLGDASDHGGDDPGERVRGERRPALPSSGDSSLPPAGMGTAAPVLRCGRQGSSFKGRQIQVKEARPRRPHS
ncbi:MAG: helicase-related protein [Acidimicrobiia bacterium]